MYFLANSGLLVHNIADEAVIVSTANAMILSLNITGTFIFEQLQKGKHTILGLSNALALEFDVDPQSTRMDLEEFIQILIDNGLVSCSLQ